MSEPVVVCLGLSRTGTTSFGDACEYLGFTRLGWSERSEELLRAWHEGRFDDLYAVAGGYQVIEDLPWPLLYRELADRFPQTRFVLTRRVSVEVWLASQIAHTSKWDELWALEPIYGDTRPQRAPEAYCRTYERHLREVRRFFASSERLSARLLEVCWETGSGWTELCPFLGVPVPKGVPFPHANASVPTPDPDVGLRWQR
ncbi:MAG TPA: sulfotransferase [Actinomycetota bacterium]|nr:sulfotransferase [Actinomycetota bacterium]